MSEQTCYSVCIIGAGLAGLVAAQTLLDSGVRDVIMLDKGRSVGGRFATRRVDDGLADHGAQFVSARSALFYEKCIEPELRNGALRVWFSDKGEKYVAVNGMNEWLKQWAKRIGETYRLLTDVKVERMEEDESEWRIVTECGMIVRAKALIVTAPLPQSLALTVSLQKTWNQAELQRLNEVAYDPCLALLVSLNGESAVAPPGYCRTELPEPVSWIADNKLKGISNQTVVTVHLRGDWSDTHYSDSDESIIAAIMPLLTSFFGEQSVSQVQVKRWRYALSKHLYPAPCYVANNRLPLLLAGDGFSCEPHHPAEEQGRAETAYLSGVAVARQLLGG
jgi:renalase